VADVYFPSFEKFSTLAKDFDLIPVYREIVADRETPVSVFMRFKEDKYAFLLESVEGGEKWARYSFLGSEPSLIIQSRPCSLELVGKGYVREIKASSGRLNAFSKVMETYHPCEAEGLPRFFGGAVGYLGYDLVRDLERIQDLGKPGLSIPDLNFMITDSLLIFDSFTHKIKVVSNVHLQGQTLESAYKEATGKIEQIIARLQIRPDVEHQHPSSVPSTDIQSNLSQYEFEKLVMRAKDYIRNGDVFQIVLSQRFEVPVQVDPFQIYRALRLINPSPYMYYLRFGDLYLVGSSPEVLVRSEEERVEARPIAGTRKRGRSLQEDKKLEAELLSDPKEGAEHIMLVDLTRNDLGRICAAGSIHVDDLMAVEKYSHVMHLVSHVQGRLAPRRNSCDVIKACFPAGTVSGAPKIRAMQIIEELESVRRGPYAGAVGYFGFSGNLDACINIRTIVIRGNKAFIQAGAGIVADSDPHLEYHETVNKAKAMIAAIELAEKGLISL
jgi:anthranilate synthase component 1